MTLSGARCPSACGGQQYRYGVESQARPQAGPFHLYQQYARACRLLLELAQKIAAHESPRTTKLYDRPSDQYPLDERTYRNLKRYITIASAILPTRPPMPSCPYK